MNPNMPRIPSPEMLPRLGAIGILVALLVGLMMLIVTLVIWWRIVSKTGYSGVLSLLMFVPVANLILLFVLAFSKWPIEEKLDYWRDSQ